jgi:hypothetical protein
MRRPGHVTDDQMEALDIDTLVIDGIRSPAARARLFGEGAVAAAIKTDRSGTEPRSLTFLAEIVRRGGIAYASRLPEPLVTPEQSALARDWLAAALRGEAEDQTLARWLDAVAAILTMRREARRDWP